MDLRLNIQLNTDRLIFNQGYVISRRTICTPKGNTIHQSLSMEWKFNGMKSFLSAGRPNAIIIRLPCTKVKKIYIYPTFIHTFIHVIERSVYTANQGFLCSLWQSYAHLTSLLTFPLSDLSSHRSRFRRAFSTYLGTSLSLMSNRCKINEFDLTWLD